MEEDTRTPWLILVVVVVAIVLLQLVGSCTARLTWRPPEGPQAMETSDD